MKIILAGLVIVIVALIVAILCVLRKKTDGSIIINKTDLMEEYLTLELRIPVSELDRRKKVIFDIREV